MTKWKPVPNPVSCFTDEQNFAYRLREIMSSAFFNGALFAIENPLAVSHLMDGHPIVVFENDVIGEGFEMWAPEKTDALAAYFGLGDAGLKYFEPGKSSVDGQR